MDLQKFNFRKIKKRKKYNFDIDWQGTDKLETKIEL